MAPCSPSPPLPTPLDSTDSRDANTSINGKSFSSWQRQAHCIPSRKTEVTWIYRAADRGYCAFRFRKQQRGRPTCSGVQICSLITVWPRRCRRELSDHSVGRRQFVDVVRRRVAFQFARLSGWRVVLREITRLTKYFHIFPLRFAATCF